MIKCASIQMQSKANSDANLASAQRMITTAASEGAELIVLPEMFALMGGTDAQKRKVSEPFRIGPIQTKLAQIARENQIWLAAGTLPITEANQKNPNSSCMLFSPEGEIINRYDKIHLFDVDLPNGDSYRESDTYSHGKEPTMIETPFGRLGFAVCYDLRFPELFVRYRELEVDVIIVPAAFTAHTGAVHWQVLLQARALDAGAFIIAANQAGRHDNQWHSYGHSMIVDPWGQVVSMKDDEESGIVYADIDIGTVKKVRGALALSSNAKLK